MTILGLRTGLTGQNILRFTHAFADRFGQTVLGSWIQRLTTYVPTDQETVHHRWLGIGPGLSLWNGTRALDELKTFDYQLSNKLFSAGLTVSVDDLRRDQSGGMIVQRINELADAAALHPETLLTEVIEAGETTTCYDGQYFFDTDHPAGGDPDSGVTQSNDITFNVGTTTAPTYEEMSKAFIAGIKNMLGWKDQNGKPRNHNQRTWVAMVPIGLMDAALGAIATQFITNGVTNPLVGLTDNGFRIEIVANANLSWTDKFMLVASGDALRPFLFQEEYGPKLDVIGPGSEQEIIERRHVYVVERMYNIGYGRPDGACLVTLT